MKQLFFFLFLIYLPAAAQVSPVYSDPLNFIDGSDEAITDAMEMIRYGDPEGAIRHLKKDFKKSNRTFECEFLIGYSYKMLGDLTNAIEYFSKATRYEASSLPAFFERGNCFLLRKNFAQAVFDYNHVIILDSTFAPAYNNRAYARIRNYGERIKPEYQLKLARLDMEKVIKLSVFNDSTQRFEYYFNLGLLDLYISDYERARVSFSHAISISPNQGKAYYYRAASSFLAHFYKEAEGDFNIANNLGYLQSNTPDFLKVIDLVAEHQQTTGEYIGK